MVDPRQTVESLRSFLKTGGMTLTADMSGLADNYADLCREVNQRLARCADFLRQGLRGEAIEFAQSEPPLLPLAQMLAFPERGTWEQACVAGGLRAPARLAMETVSDLDLAIIQQEPLRELLARHRHAALAYAPMAERLAILRHLIEVDPSSTIWRRDAAEMEHARFGAMRGEAAAAIAGEDFAVIDRLLAELESAPWQAPLPAELKENLTRISAAHHKAHAIAELQALVPQVRSAFAAMSLPECRQVFAQWGRVVKQSRMVVPAELRQEIIPMARWLDEQEDQSESQKSFAAACESLNDAIQIQAQPEQLKQLYRLATKFEQEIPADVEKAYRAAMEKARREDRAERRNQYLLAAALVGAIATALVALAIVIYHSSKHL